MVGGAVIAAWVWAVIARSAAIPAWRLIMILIRGCVSGAAHRLRGRWGRTEYGIEKTSSKHRLTARCIANSLKEILRLVVFDEFGNG